MAKMKIYTHEEFLDDTFGPIGTPERDEFEAKVAADLQTYFLGEAMKEAREAQRLTQEQLGERIGVKKAQVSRLERSGSMTLGTIARVFRALGVPVTLQIGDIRRLELC